VLDRTTRDYLELVAAQRFRPCDFQDSN